MPVYHCYRIGDDRLIAEAKIVPPTSQNQGQIEDDLRDFVPSVLDCDDAYGTRRCEQLIRNLERVPRRSVALQPSPAWGVSSMRLCAGSAL